MIKSIPLLKIGGIPIEINYSWILIFVLVSANLALHWFPEEIPSRPAILYYALGATGAILLFVCVLLHELSHSLVAKRAGSQVHGIVLHVFGGVSLIREDDYTPALEFKVAVAGPLASVLLGGVFLGLRKFLFTQPGTVGYSMLTYLYFINLMLAIFNLLPGFPLDGGRILRSLVAFWKKDLLAATQIASRTGVLFAFFLMAYGLITILTGNLWGIWTVLIGIFLKDAAESSYKQLLLRDIFREGTIDQIMQRSPVVIPPDITVQQLIDDYLWHYPYGSFPVGQDAALGIITFTDIKKVPPDQRTLLRVRDVMHPISDLLRIAVGDSILTAFEKATNSGVGRLIVVDPQDHILGYLSLRDIARAFHYRSQLRQK